MEENRIKTGTAWTPARAPPKLDVRVKIYIGQRGELGSYSASLHENIKFQCILRKSGSELPKTSDLCITERKARKKREDVRRPC